MSTNKAQRCRAALWVLGGLSTTVLALYALALSFERQVDFEVYRMGGQHVFGTGLYTSHLTVFAGHFLFTYTPAAALLFWPLSHLSTWTGALIWDCANMAALAALIAVSSAAVRERQVARADWQLALIALAPVTLLLWPVRYGFDLGQVNVILVLMIVVDLTVGLSWRGRRLPEGTLVGIAAAIKLTPLIFIPYLLATRQWRAAKNAILAFVVFAAAVAAVAPRASWTYFSHYALDTGRIGPASIINNQTLRAGLARADLSPPHIVTDVLIVFVFSAGLALAAVAFRNSSRFLGILLCAATGLTISPISWQHHYVWCVPLLVWLIFGVDRPRRGLAWAALAGIVFMVPLPDQSTHLTALSYVRDNAYVISALGFVTLSSLMLWTRHRTCTRTHRCRAAPDGASDGRDFERVAHDSSAHRAPATRDAVAG